MAAYYNYNQATPNVGQRRPRDDDDFLYRPTSTSTSTSSTFGPSQTQLSRPSYTSPTQPSTSTSNSLILHPTANQEHGTTLDSYQNGEKVSRAAQLIERELTYDEKRVYVLDKLETRENNGWYHYEKTRLSLRRQVAIPQAIIDQYDNLECQSFVGLLPEINRAYITIDNKLFLWNYHDGSDFYLYDDISQLIVSVALIRPRPDVFVKAIKFVLVVATPVEIMLLGVKFDGDHVYGALTLYPTQFSIPSDNIHMLRIVGTATGRILMCGRDGCVYELQYSAKDGWWYNKCRKINHSARPLSSIKSVLPSFLFGSGEDPIENLVIDDSRTPPRLYTLSSRSAIQVYSLGNDGQSMIFQSRNTRILEEAVRVLGDKRTEDWTAKDFKIVNIAVIPRTEAEKIVLVGITSHGHRIYFHLTQSHFHYGGVDLTVRFVRLCPPYVTEPDIRPRHVVSGMITQPYEPGYKKGKSPETIHQAFYRNGVVLMADAGRSVAHDTLIALNPDLDLQSSKLIESVEARDVETRIADLSEVSPSFYLSLVASTLYARGYDVPLAGLNEFATQHALPPRQFLILTSSGLLTFIKHRPIDDLRDILIRRRKTNDDAELVLFFTQYGLKEACAMCLVVACATPQAPVLQITDESTTNRFNIQNNTSTLTTPNRYTTQPTDPTHDIHLQRAAKQAFFRFGAEPDIHPTYETHVGSHLARSTFTASGKHDGLALYLSRLIRPLWDWSIVVYNRDDPRHISLRYSRQHFIELSTPLRHLQSFIHDNIRLLLLDTSRHTPADSVSRQENQSIDAMRILLDLTCQALSLLCILATQNNFVAICNRLSPTDLSRLRDSKFYDLITSHDGHALLRALIAAMMELRDPTQPEDHALVTKLHTECPILFGNGDLLNYKAMECLEKAKLESSRAERDLLLSRAFQLYHTAAHDRYFTLEQACARLRDVHHYSGVVTLCLDRAMWIRSGEISPAKTLPQTYGQVGTSTVTTEQDFIDNETRRCYDCIIETLDVLVLGRTRVKERATSVTLPLTPDEKALMREKVLALSRDSNDPHFLSRLYHWYITNDLTEDLLSTPSPHLIRFLTTSESYVNLLRDYYLRHNMYKPAAILLCELSYKKTDEYTLADRIGFLSRALSCAQKCIDMARTTPMDDTYDTRDGLAQQYTIDGDMAFFLRDRIEIAKIQAKIHSRLKAMVDENYNTAQVQRINEETKENKYEQEESIKRFNDRRTEIQNALKQLDYELFDIDPLYVFAQQFGLWEICLYIFNFSNERNRDDVIRALWSNIFRESIARAVPQHMDWTLIVRDQLIELSRQYHHDENPFIFPLQHIVKELENDNYNYRPHPTPDFVIPSLLAAGISPHSLIDVYDHLIEQSRSEQNDEEKKLMIGSVLMLLEQGTQQARVPRTRGVRQGRFPYDQAFNLISKCLTELQTMQQTPDVERLESDLKSLQSRLRMSL